MLVYFLLLTAVLPQVSESIFSPCLPLIASSFSESISACEHVFTTYLFGYAIGMLFWGSLSDYYGRVRTLGWGLGVYLLGVFLCYISYGLSWLLIARCIQGIGGSSCSVLVLAMCRDCFKKKERAGMLAKMGMAMSIGPMLGPLMGASILLFSNWYNIYIVLTLYALLILALSYHLPVIKNKVIEPNLKQYKEVIASRNIWLFALIIGHACGIGFSFLSESPYFYKVFLGLSESQFSLCFMLVGLSWYCGGRLSYRLLKRFPIERVMLSGVVFSMISCTVFIAVVMLMKPSLALILASLTCVFCIMSGMGLVIGNAITLALEPFEHCSGTASSVLGFLYYTVIALVSAGMAEFHNGTLLALPLYWFNVLMVCFVMVLSIQPGRLVLFKNRWSA